MSKIRNHVKVPLDEKLEFHDVVTMILDLCKNVINDELINFVWIDDDGIMEGQIKPSEDGFSYPTTGTFMRLYTKNNRWSFILIKRGEDGYVSLIDVSAPKQNKKKFDAVLEHLVELTNGEINGSI
jgi:hypothetical protein